MLIITVVSGPDKGRVYRLADNARHRIGRHRGSVALDDRSVSSGHAEITESDGQWTVTDLGSSNGTFVNKRRLEHNQPEPIEDGDRIQFGRTMVVFNLVAEVDPSATGARDLPTHHAALAIEERNQQLLEQIARTLAEHADAHPPAIGDQPAQAPAYDDSALRDMLEQVLQRLDTQPAASGAPAADPALVEKLDAVLDAVRAHGDDELLTRLDAVIEMVSSHSTGRLERQLDELRATLAQAPAPQPVHVPDPAEAVAPLAERIDALRQTVETLKAESDDADEPVDLAAALKPQLDDILDTVRDAPAPAKAVEAKVDKLLAATAVDGRAYIAPKLEAILEAVNTSGESALAEKLDAILEAAGRDNTAELAAKIDALADSLPRYDDQPLRDRLDQLLAASEAQPDDALAGKLDELLELARRDPAAALTEKLDAMLEAMPRYDDQPLRDRLDELMQAVQRDQTAALSAKLDDVLEAVTRPADAEDASAGNTEILDKLDAVLEAARTDRSAQIAAKLEAAIETFQGPRHEALQQQLAALETALRQSADQQPPAVELVDLSPVQEQLAAIRRGIEQMQSKTGESGDADAGGDSEVVDRKLDVLIDAATAANESTSELAEKLDTIIIELADQQDDDVEARLTRVLETMIETADNAAVLDALHAIRQRLDSLTDQPQPEPVDPAPAVAEALRPTLDQILQAVRELPAVKEETDDLRPLIQQVLDKVNEPAPEPPTLPEVPDVQPQFDRLHAALGELRDRMLEAATAPDEAPTPEPVDLTPVLDQLAALQKRLDEQPAAPAEASDLKPMLREVLEAVQAQRQREAEQAAPAAADRTSELIERIEKLDMKFEAGVPVDTPDHRPMLRRILEVVEHNHGKPDGVPTDEKQLETLLRKIHDRLNGLAAPSDSQRVLSDLFSLLRSIEQEQQRQADAIHLLAENTREASRADHRVRDRLLEDHEPLPRPSHSRTTPAASVVVPHQAPQSSPGGRSVLVTVVVYVGITLAILWGALSITDGRLFNPFSAGAAPTPSSAPAATPETRRGDIDAEPPTASGESVQLSSRTRLP